MIERFLGGQHGIRFIHSDKIIGKWTSGWWGELAMSIKHAYSAGSAQGQVGTGLTVKQLARDKRRLSMWDFLGKVAGTQQRGLKWNCYHEFSSGSDLLLRMLEAGREQLGVRLHTGIQVRTQGQQ